jgi:hypothetical protein
MKLFSKTLLSAAVLSCFSLPSHADILDPGINYCKTRGGCGTNETFPEIAKNVFSTCSRSSLEEPYKSACDEFNKKLNEDYQKKADLAKDYVKKVDVKNEVSKCIGLTQENIFDPNHSDNKYCNEIRNDVLDKIYIPKGWAQSYIIFPPATKGADALYLGSTEETNKGNPDTVGTFIKNADDFNKLDGIKANPNRLSFKWITGLDEKGNPISKCGIVIGLKASGTNLNADEGNIICKTDIPAIEKCPTDKLTCGQ